MSKIALTPVVLLLGSALLGQTTEVLGPHNVAFLEGLWRNGYLEYADAIGRLVEASNLPAPEKQLVGTSYTRLQIAVKAKEGDAKGRRDLVLKVLAEKAAQITAAPAGSDAAVDALGEWIDQFRLLADAVAEALGQESDLSAQTKMREESEKYFTAGETELQEKKKTFDKLRKDDDPATDAPFLVAFYGIGKLYYYHSLLFAADSPGGKRLVQQSLDTLEEFDLEFGDTLAAFEAKLTTALCHQRLGDAEQALADCDDAIKLRERFEPRGKDGVYPVDRNAADVIAVAFVQKAMMLKDRKEPAKIIEAAKDYFATIPDALQAQQGPGVLAAKAEAHLALGETDAATADAQKLQEIDPKGKWGYRGQELLAQIINSGSGPKIGAEKMLGIASSLAQQGNLEQALRTCRGVLLQSKAPDDAKYAAQALVVIGFIMWDRGWYHEASVAFDAVVRRYPKTEIAPDALWRAIQCFDELDSSDGGMWKAYVEQRSNQLVRDYPTDVHVAQLQLLAGQRLDKAQKYLDAATVFEKIGAESSVHLDARFYANNCYGKHGRKLRADGQEKESQPFIDRAVKGFNTLLQDVDAAKLVASDAKVKARLEQVELGTRIGLASLLLVGNANPAEADKVLKSVSVKDDDKQAPMVWGLRIRSKLAQKNLEEAASDMEAALTRFGEDRSLLATCRALATELDNRAIEENKQKRSVQAKALWSKAQSYYLRSANGASDADIAQIAERLMIIGLIVNQVDEKVEGWFELPEFRVASAESWESALELYGRLAEKGATSYKGRIGRSRIFGFMGRWAECEGELRQLFVENKNVLVKGRLDSQVLARRPELLSAYLEYGFALCKPIQGSDEKSRRAQATDVFNRINGSFQQLETKHSWFARFGQIQTLYDRGLYDEAGVAMASLERTNPELDGGKYGLVSRFKTLKIAIQSKRPK
jgi:tetratricopeptide (TPR) repeat protein